MTFEEIKSKLDISRENKGGDELICHCKCSVHKNGDRSPSLIVRRSNRPEKFTAIFACMTGGSYNDVLNAHGISPEDNYGTDYQKKRVKTEYLRHHVYHDDSGKPIFIKEILRDTSASNGKRAIWFPVDTEGKKILLENPIDKWHLYQTGIPIGFEMPLYNPNKEIAYFTKKQRIFICEGEKDADTLKNTLNIPALSLHAGTNSKLNAKQINFLTNRSIVIIEDYDSAGKKLSNYLIKTLFLFCFKIQLITMDMFHDSPQENEDISDVIELLGQKKVFDIMIKNLSNSDSAVNLTTAREIILSELK